MPPASWPTDLHLLRLVDLVLQRALPGGFERIDDRGFAVALLLLDRGDVEARRSARRSPSSAASTGAISPCPVGGLADRRFQRLAVALGDHGEDRAVVAALAFSAAWNRRANSALVRAILPALSTVAIAIGVLLEEAHEAHFGGALRIGRRRRARG